MRLPKITKLGFKKMLPALIAILVVGASFQIGMAGMKKMQEAKAQYEQKLVTYEINSQRSSGLMQYKRQLENQKQAWKTTVNQTPLAYNVEGGSFFAELGDLAERNGIKNITVTPREKEIGFLNGHLRAVPYDLKISGPFVKVFNVLYGMENIKSPVEIKPIKISAVNNGEEVSVETTIVLYSLNPPAKYDFVKGSAGRSDPFFNSDIATKILKAQERQEEKEETQAQQKELPSDEQKTPNSNKDADKDTDKEPQNAENGTISGSESLTTIPQ